MAGAQAPSAGAWVGGGCLDALRAACGAAADGAELAARFPSGQLR